MPSKRKREFRLALYIKPSSKLVALLDRAMQLHMERGETVSRADVVEAALEYYLKNQPPKN